MPYTNDKLDTLIKRAGDLRKDFRKQVEKVKQNNELSRTGKQKRVDELHETILEAVEDQRKQFHDTAADVRTTLSGNAWKFDGSKAELMQFDDMVYRLTQEDVKPAERQARLEQGSAVTALAVAKAAYERGDSNTLNLYGEKYPDKAKPIRRLLEFERRYGNKKSAEDKLSDNMAFTKPKRPHIRR